MSDLEKTKKGLRLKTKYINPRKDKQLKTLSTSEYYRAEIYTEYMMKNASEW